MTLEQVLDDIEKLNSEEQRLLIDIVRKRLINVERAEINEEYNNLKSLKVSGKLKTYSVDEFFEKIES